MFLLHDHQYDLSWDESSKRTSNPVTLAQLHGRTSFLPDHLRTVITITIVIVITISSP